MMRSGISFWDNFAAYKTEFELVEEQRRIVLMYPDYITIKPENQVFLFFTSDQHFGHSNVIHLCDRPFADVIEMREALIRNWNSVVPEKGVVVVLGDVFWKRNQLDDHMEIMRRLNGTKHLVLGSHDKLHVEDYEEIGFASISKIVKVFVGPHSMVCSHCPFLEWDGYWRGAWHLHGHTHGRMRHPSVRAIDVGVDPNNYTPIRFTDIRKKLGPLAEKEMAILAARQWHNPLGAVTDAD